MASDRSRLLAAHDENNQLNEALAKLRQAILQDPNASHDS